MYRFVVKGIDSGIIVKEFYHLIDLYNELQLYLPYVENSNIIIYKER